MGLWVVPLRHLDDKHEERVHLDENGDDQQGVVDLVLNALRVFVVLRVLKRPALQEPVRLDKKCKGFKNKSVEKLGAIEGLPLVNLPLDLEPFEIEPLDAVKVDELEQREHVGRDQDYFEFPLLAGEGGLTVNLVVQVILVVKTHVRGLQLENHDKKGESDLARPLVHDLLEKEIGELDAVSGHAEILVFLVGENQRIFFDLVHLLKIIFSF